MEERGNKLINLPTQSTGWVRAIRTDENNYG